MDVDVQILAWLALVASGVSNALTVWNFFQSPSRKNETAIKTVADSLGALITTMDARLALAEKQLGIFQVQLQHVPSAAELHSLEKNLVQVSGDIAVLNARLEPVQHLGKRLQEFILQDKT